MASFGLACARKKLKVKDKMVGPTSQTKKGSGCEWATAEARPRGLGRSEKEMGLGKGK